MKRSTAPSPGFPEIPQNLQGAPTLCRQQGAFFLSVLWGRCDSLSGTGKNTGWERVVYYHVGQFFFNQVTSGQVTFSSGEEMWYAKPSHFRNVILKNYYLSLHLSFGWVQSQHNETMARSSEKNEFRLCLQAKERRKEDTLNKSSTGNIAKVFLNWRLYHHLRYFFSTILPSILQNCI